MIEFQTISDTFNASGELIKEAMNSLIQTLVQTKEYLHESVESLGGDLEEVVEVQDDGDEEGDVGEQEDGGDTALHRSIDTIVQTMSQIPVKVSMMFGQPEEEAFPDDVPSRQGEQNSMSEANVTNFIVDQLRRTL